MEKMNRLKTETEELCGQCGKQILRTGSKEVSAARPVDVELICPDCGALCTAQLTVEQIFQSIYPHLTDLSLELSAENDNGFLTDLAWSKIHTPLTHSNLPPNSLLH